MVTPWNLKFKLAVSESVVWVRQEHMNCLWAARMLLVWAKWQRDLNWSCSRQFNAWFSPQQSLIEAYHWTKNNKCKVVSTKYKCTSYDCHLHAFWPLNRTENKDLSYSGLCESGDSMRQHNGSCFEYWILSRKSCSRYESPWNLERAWYIPPAHAVSMVTQACTNMNTIARAIILVCNI